MGLAAALKNRSSSLAFASSGMARSIGALRCDFSVPELSLGGGILRCRLRKNYIGTLLSYGAGCGFEKSILLARLRKLRNGSLDRSASLRFFCAGAQPRGRHTALPPKKKLHRNTA